MLLCAQKAPTIGTWCSQLDHVVSKHLGYTAFIRHERVHMLALEYILHVCDSRSGMPESLIYFLPRAEPFSPYIRLCKIVKLSEDQECAELFGWPFWVLAGCPELCKGRVRSPADAAQKFPRAQRPQVGQHCAAGARSVHAHRSGDISRSRRSPA